MTKHRYLLIEISKEFEPIVKNSKTIPTDDNNIYCIIDLATATISKDGKTWNKFEVEGEVTLPESEKSKIITEVLSKTPCPDISFEHGIENQFSKTLNVIDKLTHFKPCSNNDNQSCESHLSLGKGCIGCPHNEAEKSK